MPGRLRLNQDLLAGLIFGAFGASFLYFGRQLPVGTLTEMESGYFPMLLGGLLLGIAAILIVRGAATEGEALGRWAFRPWILVPCSFLAFAFAIERYGLVVAGIVCMLIAAISGKEFRLGEQVVLAVCLVAVATAGFIFLLGLPMNALPTSLR